MESVGALNLFVQAAEARSFTAAGQRLGISASAVGKAIARLEERLAVRLFHRSTRSIALTTEGAIFLERCRRILAEVEAAELELAQSQGSPRGILRVSLPLLDVVMMPVLARFMRAFPDVRLDLDFSDRLVDVIEEGFDAVIRAGELADSRLMSRSLGEFRLRLVAAPAYLDMRGTPRHPDQLSAHACLLHRFATSGTFEGWPLGRFASDFHASVVPAAVANTIQPLIVMAEQGLGIACLPDLAITRELETGRLIEVLEPFVAHASEFRLLWPSSRYVSPKLRVFVDYLASELPKLSSRRAGSALGEAKGSRA